MTSAEQQLSGQFEFLQESDVVIRPLVVEYAPALFSLIARNRMRVSQHGELSVRNFSDVDDVITSITDPINPLQESYIVLSRGVVTGSINLSPVYLDEEAVSIRYWIGREFARKGLASTAIKMLSDQALSRPSIEEVVAYTHQENIYSQNALENAGFSDPGVTEHGQIKFVKK